MTRPFMAICRHGGKVIGKGDVDLTSTYLINLYCYYYYSVHCRLFTVPYFLVRLSGRVLTIMHGHLGLKTYTYFNKGSFGIWSLKHRIQCNALL